MFPNMRPFMHHASRYLHMNPSMTSLFRRGLSSIQSPKQPMPLEQFRIERLSSFEDYCKEIALPLIFRSCEDPQVIKELQNPSNLQNAYEGYCQSEYRQYILKLLPPINPFIL